MKGIRANCVLPGLMNTPMIVEPLKNVYGSGGMEELVRKRDAMVPMGKMGDAWDVAYASLFLASDEAKFITGALLVVDGGAHLQMWLLVCRTELASRMQASEVRQELMDEFRAKLFFAVDGFRSPSRVSSLRVTREYFGSRAGYARFIAR